MTNLYTNTQTNNSISHCTKNEVILQHYLENGQFATYSQTNEFDFSIISDV